MKRFLNCLAIASAAVVVSLLFFSPRLLVFTDEAPGSYEWTRGLNFLEQVEGKGSQEVEPALRHRLLPVYAARVLGLDGYEPFILGWIGVLCLLACVFVLMERHGAPRRIAVSTVFLFASTSAVVTSFGWVGIFDAWWVLALVLVAFAPQFWVVAAAALLAPWIDERFLIGLPVAFAARWLINPWLANSALRLLLFIALAVGPYAAWRVYSLLHSSNDASADFISLHFLVWLRMAPHGWWMAYRLAWIFLVLAVCLPNASRITPWQLGAICFVSASAAIVTAADISRSAMVLAPLLPAGVLLAWRRAPQDTLRFTPWVAAANFVVPYMHVVYNKIETVHPLPWEIIRLIKKLAAMSP